MKDKKALLEILRIRLRGIESQRIKRGGDESLTLQRDQLIPDKNIELLLVYFGEVLDLDSKQLKRELGRYTTTPKRK